MKRLAITLFITFSFLFSGAQIPKDSTYCFYRQSHNGYQIDPEITKIRFYNAGPIRCFTIFKGQSFLNVVIGPLQKREVTKMGTFENYSAFVPSFNKNIIVGFFTTSGGLFNIGLSSGQGFLILYVLKDTRL